MSGRTRGWICAIVAFSFYATCFAQVLRSHSTDSMRSDELTGVWHFQYQGKAVARSYYSEEKKIHIGQTFPASNFFSQTQEDRDFLKRLSMIDGIEIQQDSEKNELKVRSRDNPETRIFKQDHSPVTNQDSRIYFSITPLSSQQKMVSPGCMEYEGLTERVVFQNSQRLAFYERTVYVSYVPSPSLPNSCQNFLEQLKTKIEDHQAPAFWLAAEQTHGIDLNHFQNLRKADIHFIFR